MICVGSLSQGVPARYAGHRIVICLHCQQGFPIDGHWLPKHDERAHEPHLALVSTR